MIKHSQYRDNIGLIITNLPRYDMMITYLWKVENMKIVILDAHAMNPGDLSWDKVKKYGELILFDKTKQEDIIKNIGDAQIVLTNKTVLDRETIEKMTNVQYIGVMASGYNVVDIEAAKQQNIVVTNVPGYSTPSVAQHVFALLLEAFVQVGKHNELIKQNKWALSKDFCFYQGDFFELQHKTIGVVGYGNIGKAVVKIAQAFNMNVLIYDKGRIEPCNDGKKVSFDELVSLSDIISLHVPLKTETQHMINKDTISMVKPNCVLINTARAQLVDKDALIKALNDNQLAYYCTDVFDSEPPILNDPLILHPKSIITGHMAWATKEARTRCIDNIADNIEAFINNRPINKVN